MDPTPMPTPMPTPGGPPPGGPPRSGGTPPPPGPWWWLPGVPDAADKIRYALAYPVLTALGLLFGGGPIWAYLQLT